MDTTTFKPAKQSLETYLIMAFSLVAAYFLFRDQMSAFTAWTEKIGPYVGIFTGARIGGKLLWPLVNKNGNGNGGTITPKPSLI
jgi:hypothetical protein